MGWNDCCVPGCDVTVKSVPRRSFYKLPCDVGMSESWLKRIYREDLLTVDISKCSFKYRVCSDHFSEHQYSSVGNIFGKVKKLRKFALPDIVLRCSSEIAKRDVSDIEKDQHEISCTTSISPSLLERNAIPTLHGPQTATPSRSSDPLNPIPVSIPASSENVTSPSISPPNSPVPLSPCPSPVPFTSWHMDSSFLSTLTTTDSHRRPSSPLKTFEPDHQITENILPEPTQDQNTDIPRNGREKILMCRVCGIQNFFPICIYKYTYSEKFLDTTVVQMLIKHLPIKIHVDDEFPINMCVNCINALNKWHELYITCAAVDKALKIAYSEDMEKDLSKDVPFTPEINPSGQKSGQLISSQEKGETRGKVESNVPENDIHTPASNLDCPDKQALVDVEFEDFDGNQMLVKRKKLFCKKCKFCGALFTSLSGYNIHLHVCKESSTICEICGKFILKRRLFMRHYRHNHQVIKVLCHQCGECVNINKLYKHRQKHSGDEQIPCFECCSIYRTKSLYKQHKKLHEQGKIKFSFQIESTIKEGKTHFECPVCCEMFSEKLSLIKHLIQPKSLKCAQCRIRLRCEKSLLSHKCKKYHCKYCFKSFYIKISFQNHERLHTGEKPFKCHVCEKVFTARHYLSMHRKIHKPPTHECTFCAKKFKYATTLKSHMNHHEGIFKYACDLCPKKYAFLKSLAKHKIKKH